MRGIRPLVLLGICIALTVAIAGCSGGDKTPSNDTGTVPPAESGNGSDSGSGEAPGGVGLTVVESGFAFSPATLEVAVGDTVTFINEDSSPHIVKIDGRELESQSQGDSVTWTAEKSGSFPYVCTIHPSMTGTIEVK